MKTEPPVHRHTHRRYIPRLMNITGALRLSVETLEEIVGAIDPEDSFKNDDPGTDPEGAAALETIVDGLYDAAIALHKITGENYVALLGKSWDADKVEETSDEDETAAK